MKKNISDRSLDNLDISSNNNLISKDIKTTNVNILLNRVRLDKRRAFKKRIIIFTILVTFVSTLTFYFII